MKKLKRVELKSTPKMQDLQFEEMKYFSGGMGTWNEEFGTYMLDEVTVYGYPNDGRYHVGDATNCKRCNLSNPDIDGCWRDYSDGATGACMGTSVYHDLNRVR
jgi:hypothetical protein